MLTLCMFLNEHCICYLSHYCSTVSGKNNIKKEEFILAHGLRVQSIVVRKEAIAAGPRGSWSHCIFLSQETETKCSYLACFLPFYLVLGPTSLSATTHI